MEHGEKGKSQTKQIKKKANKKEQKKNANGLHIYAKSSFACQKKMTENICVPTSIARFYYCYFFYTTKKQNLTGDILSVSLFCCFYNNNKKKFVDVCIVQQTHHGLIKLSVFFF